MASKVIPWKRVLSRCWKGSDLVCHVDQPFWAWWVEIHMGHNPHTHQHCQYNPACRSKNQRHATSPHCDPSSNLNHSLSPVNDIPCWVNTRVTPLTSVEPARMFWWRFDWCNYRPIKVVVVQLEFLWIDAPHIPQQNVSFHAGPKLLLIFTLRSECD